MTDLSSESMMVAAVRSRRWRLKLALAAALATMVLVAPTAPLVRQAPGRARGSRNWSRDQAASRRLRRPLRPRVTSCCAVTGRRPIPSSQT